MRYRLPNANLAALAKVPGAVPSRGTSPGPPRNCRALLGLPPIEEGEPWLTPPPELEDWVPEWLTPYQKRGWAFLVARRGGLLYHPPGAGKTAAGLCAGLTCAQGGKKIIVITRATTRRQWDREVQRLSSLRPKIVRGRTPTPIERDVRCIILGWETLTDWVGALIAWGGRDFVVILDEIHKAKSSRRHEKYVKAAGVIGWRTAKNITASTAKLSKAAGYRIGLSATPAPNELSDLWSVLDILEPGCWGRSLDWARRYCGAFQNQWGGWDTGGRSNIPELKARVAEIMHKVNRAEVFENMPPKRRELCYLSKEDQSRPVGFKKDLQEAARQGKNALFEMRLMEAAARKRKWVIDTALDCIIEYNQKVVILTGRKKDCEAIASSLEKKLAKVEDAEMWWGHGGVSTHARDKMVQAYSERPSRAAFVGTTDAFGEAIDGLQHTDLAICCLLPWNGGRVEQMEGRFHRKSSTRPVRIMYVIAEGTVDEHVSDLVLRKLNNIEKALDHQEARDIADTLAGLDDEDAIITSIINKMGGM